MNKLTKLLFASLLFSISSVVFAHYGEFASIYSQEEIEQSNKEYRANQIKEIHEFMARDNALTQKFVKDKNSKPFIDEREEFSSIQKVKNRLWAKQMDFGGKETVAEMIIALQNFIKNLDIKWDLAKQRGYFDLEKTTPVFLSKRSDAEELLNKLQNKLNKL